MYVELEPNWTKNFNDCSAEQLFNCKVVIKSEKTMFDMFLSLYFCGMQVVSYCEAKNSEFFVVP